MVSAQSVIERFSLQPHPEGGHYRELYRHQAPDGKRGVATSILFLLTAGEESAWHCVDAVEIWHYHAGAPLALTISAENGIQDTRLLSAGMNDDGLPQQVVGINQWQSAKSLGDWTLVGCTVAPAFSFDGFELACPGWSPGNLPK